MRRVRLSSHQSPVHKLGASQITISPKFKLAPPPPSSLDPARETATPLIPGLPDDVALQCLLRVPLYCHPSCRPVCRRWSSFFGSKARFLTLRKDLGFQDPWLVVFAYHKSTGKIEWKVLDLNRRSWHSVPAMPCRDRVCPQGFRCVSIPLEGALYVFGGVASDVDCPLNLVLKYEAWNDKWAVMRKMIAARSFFAAGVVDGMIYIAGGNSADLFELNSAEVFDPDSGLWRPVSNMRTSMSAYDSAVLDGKILVTEGWFWPFYVVPRGQVYDPSVDRWGNMAAGLREGWTGSSVVVDGQLFVVTEHERTRMKVYDSRSDSWEAVEGPALPEQICRPFKVGGWGWEIYVVGRNLHVAVGRVKRGGPDGRESGAKFRVEWQVVDAPDSLFDLMPSSAQVLFA